MRSMYTLNLSSEDLGESIVTKTSVLQYACDCTSAVHLASAITVTGDSRGSIRLYFIMAQGELHSTESPGHNAPAPR
jgi:hypothetical protein